MKTKLLLLGAVLMISFSANAAKWRVNNTEGVNADFRTGQAAHDAAEQGDTLYFEGSSIMYKDEITLTKQLVLIGPGYFLTENENTQSIPLEAIISKLTISPGSQGSIIKGLNLNYVFAVTNNILITQCRINSLIFERDHELGTDCIISKNFIDYLGGYGNNNYGVATVSISGNLIYNNYIKFFQPMVGGGRMTVVNNVILSGLSVMNSTIRNNIVPNEISNNRGSRYDYASRNNIIQDNLVSDNLKDVFITYPFVNDSELKLKDGVVKATNGDEFGVFGGTDPYILSGIPKGPHIYSAEVDSEASETNGLQVNLKITTKR